MLKHDPDRKAWNSTLRPVAKRKIGLPKKPRVFKKPKLKEVVKRFGIVTAAMLGEPKKRKPIPKRSKTNTGWYQWAIDNVWSKREHQCEVCNAPLGDDERPAPIVFSHLLPRKTYRRYKCDIHNVFLKCADCHNEWHDQGPEKLSARREWANVCRAYYFLRDEANGLTKK